MPKSSQDKTFLKNSLNQIIVVDNTNLFQDPAQVGALLVVTLWSLGLYVI